MNESELQERFLKGAVAAAKAAKERNAPIIAKLLDGQKPYDVEELRNPKKHKIKGSFAGKWYEFETTTRFISCGLIQQCERLYEEASCVECDPPKEGEFAVILIDNRRGVCKSA